MKKKNLLVILSIIEIVLIIVFIYSSYVAFTKTFDLSLNGITSSWIGSKPVELSESDKFLIKLSNILPYIILLVMIIRFIFIDKKKKIALGLSLVSIILFVLCFRTFAFEIVRLLGLVFLLLAIILYIYSHIINNKDESMIFEKRRKRNKNKL